VINADIAVISLAVMGQNLILNMNDHGFKVVAFNSTVLKVDKFLATAAKDPDVIAAHSLEEMLSLLAFPRKIMLVVKEGEFFHSNWTGLGGKTSSTTHDA